jgi:hypothetical protein
MTTIDDLFCIHRARSGLFSAYEAGSVAYISNTSDHNGVVGFVEPLDSDTVFNFTAHIPLLGLSHFPAIIPTRARTQTAGLSTPFIPLELPQSMTAFLGRQPS